MINIGNIFCGVILFAISQRCFSNRKIDFTDNPNCTVDCDKPWLIYGKGESENSTVHYLWSAVKLPSFTMVLTDPETELIIDWKNLGSENSVSFSKPQESCIGISFQTLILFNDLNDTGLLDNVTASGKQNASLSDFEWRVTKNENISSGEVVVQFSTTSFRNESLDNGTGIIIRVTAFGNDGRDDNLPHLITTAESSHFEIKLINLTLDFNQTISQPEMHNDHSNHEIEDHPSYLAIPISGFDHGRWALDAVITSSDNTTGTSDEMLFTMTNLKSLDDEHAPGVFDIESISTPTARQPSSPNMGGYLQWRPVAYLTHVPNINSATYPNVNSSLPSHLDEEHLENTKKSLLYSLYGEKVANMSTQTTIAFGLSGDGFYTNSNYTVWSFAMGLGTVPEETFSSTLIIIIVAGVGIPFILLVVGCLYLGVKKYQRLGSPLIDED